MKKILLSLVILLLTTAAVAQSLLLSRIEGIGGEAVVLYKDGQYHLAAKGDIIKAMVTSPVTTAQLDLIKANLIKANNEAKKLNVGNKGKELKLAFEYLHVLIWGDNNPQVGRKVNFLLETQHGKVLIILNAGKDTDQAINALATRYK